MKHKITAALIAGASALIACVAIWLVSHYFLNGDFSFDQAYWWVSGNMVGAFGYAGWKL